MRKIILFTLSLMTVFALQAQSVKFPNQENTNSLKKAGVTKTSKNSLSGAKAIIFFEGFESGIPATWLNIDSDGDGYKWTIIPEFRTHSGTGCISSASYINDVGPLTPSNWLITPEITLPNLGNIHLEYWVTGQDQLWPEEYYKCLISPTGGSDISNFTVTLVEETLTAGDGTENNYFKRVFDISSYANSTIRIAWLHTNSSDNYFINLDDISIYESSVTDAELVELILPSPSCDLLENIPVTIRVRNNGTAAISNVPVSFKKGLDGISINETIAGPIASDSIVSYTFTAFADFSVAGQIDSVQAKVSLENDEVATNNTSEWVSTYSVSPVSIPYSVDFEDLEDLTGWKTIDANEDGESWFIGNSTALAHSGSGVAAINTGESTAANDWLISTCINLNQGYYSISYWYRTQDTQHPENLKIAYGTEQTAAGMTNVLNDHPGITNNTYAKGQKIFSVPTTGTYYFGIHGYSNANSNRLLVDDISIDVSTGINETNVASKIYPNPAKDNIRVESNQFIKTVRIVNVLGQEIYNKAISNYGTEINVSHLNSGIYFVCIETNEGVKTQRVSIVK